MIKKTMILIGIFCMGVLYSCKDEKPGFEDPLNLKPNKLVFEYKNDTMLVSSGRMFQEFGPSITTTTKTYFSNHRDTVYDGWIKAVALEDRMQVKVIVYDNNTEYDRYYEIDVMGGNNGETIKVVQRTNNFYFGNP